MVRGSTRKGMVALAAAALVLLSACGRPAINGGAGAAPNAAPGAAKGSVEIRHVHGLGFTADGRQLMVPAHDGLVVLTEQGWQVSNTPKHDYMGFAMTNDGFHSSGHPAPGSGLKNPMGLVKSTDGGKTLVKLAFEGESDFHLMGVGHQSHAVYVFTPSANSKLSPGVHYSLDDGKTWKKSALQGVTGDLINIAVHPTKPEMVAIASDAGLFLSSNHGDTFEQISKDGPISAVAFSPKGDRLFYGLTQLRVYDLSGKQNQEMQTPGIPEKDAIGHIAVNPANPNEVAFATFGRNIHLSKDSGQSWREIAKDGKGI